MMLEWLRNETRQAAVLFTFKKIRIETANLRKHHLISAQSITDAGYLLLYSSRTSFFGVR
jgi:hypothetical protein